MGAITLNHPAAHDMVNHGMLREANCSPSPPTICKSPAEVKQPRQERIFGSLVDRENTHKQFSLQQTGTINFKRCIRWIEGLIRMFWRVPHVPLMCQAAAVEVVEGSARSEAAAGDLVSDLTMVRHTMAIVHCSGGLGFRVWGLGFRVYPHSPPPPPTLNKHRRSKSVGTLCLQSSPPAPVKRP